MRIISGRLRGKKLEAPKGMTTRPTTDKVKESIFNIIQFGLIDARVLDLFAGSGQLGLEAISRGAASCVLEVKGPKMLEKDYAASSTLAVHLKDQRNAIKLAKDTGAYMPLCAMATEMMGQLEELISYLDLIAMF